MLIIYTLYIPLLSSDYFTVSENLSTTVNYVLSCLCTERNGGVQCLKEPVGDWHTQNRAFGCGDWQKCVTSLNDYPLQQVVRSFKSWRENLPEISRGLLAVQQNATSAERGFPLSMRSCPQRWYTASHSTRLFLFYGMIM